MATYEHEHDIRAVGEALEAEAEARGWCSEYDEFVSSLNERLNVKLPVRLLHYQGTILVHVAFDATPDTADDKFEAISQALYHADNFHGETFDVTGTETDDYEVN